MNRPKAILEKGCLLLLLVLLCSSWVAIRTNSTVPNSGSILVGDENAGLFSLTSGFKAQLINSMSEPEGVAVDGGGSFIVVQGADAPGVYRVFPNSTVRPIATGSPFAFAEGVAIAKSGDFIVADQWSQGLYSVAPNGTVSTIFVGGLMERPMDVTVEPSGYFLVADQYGGLLNVSKASATQVLNVSAESVAPDIDGNYVFTTYTALYSFDSHTHVSTLIANGFVGAYGVTVDSVGNYIVAARNASPGTIYAVMRNGTKIPIFQGSPLAAPMRVAIVGYVDAVSFAQVAATTSSSTTSTSSTTTTGSTTTPPVTSSTSTPTTTRTSPTTTSTTPTGSTTSPGGSSGIPEFPVQLGFALLATVAIVASYVVARRVKIP